MSPYLNFRGTFANSGGHTKFHLIFTCKIENSFPEISVHELDDDSFVSRRGADYSEVVSTLP